MEATDQVQQLLETATTLVSTWGLQVIGAIAVLIVGRWAAGMLKRGATRALERAGTDATLVPFLSSMVYYLVLAVVMIAVLGLFGIETTSLVAVLATAGLAVGLALQGTLANFSSGVMLLVFRPFGKSGTSSRWLAPTGIVFSRSESSPPTLKHAGQREASSCPIRPSPAAIISNYSANDTRRNDIDLRGELRVTTSPNAEAAIQRVLAADSSVC